MNNQDPFSQANYPALERIAILLTAFLCSYLAAALLFNNLNNVFFAIMSFVLFAISALMVITAFWGLVRI